MHLDFMLCQVLLVPPVVDCFITHKHGETFFDIACGLIFCCDLFILVSLSIYMFLIFHRAMFRSVNSIGWCYYELKRIIISCMLICLFHSC